MDVDRKSAVSSRYRDRTWFFCMPDHKQAFDAAPAQYVEELR